MKYLGFGIVLAGMLLLVGNVFDFYLHSIFETYRWIGCIPVGLGLLLIATSEKGIGA